MRKLRELIVEVHRRSLWQVLGIYLVGSWIGYQVVLALTGGLGLPDWVPPFAVVLFVIGLPIVLATAFVQEGPARPRPAAPDPALFSELSLVDQWTEATVAESQPAPAQPAGAAAPRRPASLLTWRRTLSAGFAAFLVLGLSAGGYMTMRVAGVGPVGTLLARGEISALDRLVLADFGAVGADTLVALAITEALRVDLEQSRAVALVPPSFVQSALQRMGRPEDARLTEPVARELAVREGLKAVVGGDIARVGDGFTVTVRMVRAADGETLVSARENARGESELLDALDRLSRRLRERVGESLRSVRASEPLAQVTTSSLEALQLYSQASRLFATGSVSDADRVIDLLTQAIAIDPQFAMAYRAAGIAHSNQFFDFVAADSMLTRAWELRDRLTERERLLATASYHRTVTGESQLARAAYEQLLERHPTDYVALNNVAILYNEEGEHERALAHYRRLLEQDTTRRNVHTNLVVTLCMLRRGDEAAAVMEQARRRFPSDPGVDRFVAYVELCRGDLDATLPHLEAYHAGVRAPMQRALAQGDLSMIHMLAGRHTRARSLGDAMIATLADAGALVAAREVSLDLAIARMRTMGDEPAAVVDAAMQTLRSLGHDDAPPAERQYNKLAHMHLVAGDVRRAAEYRDRFRNEVVEPAPRRQQEVELQLMDGMLLIAQGRAAEGLRVVRGAYERAPCRRCSLPAVATAYDAAAMPDSAVVWYDRYLAYPIALDVLDFMWRRPALVRAAELHDQLGNEQQARAHYATLLSLWTDPEPRDRPRLDAIRARLATER